MKIKDENGVEIEVLTPAEAEAQNKIALDKAQAEFDAKMKEKDEHVEKKLKEFETGKTAQELKDIETNRKIEEAKKIAEDAGKTIVEAEARRVSSLKNNAITRFVGEDAELKKKFEENWALVNIETKDDADFLKKAEIVAKMTGINTADNASGFDITGGYVPNLTAKEKETKEKEFETFKNVLPGMDEFLKPKSTGEEKK